MDKRPLVACLILSVIAVIVGIGLLARAGYISSLEAELPTRGIRTKARVVASRHYVLNSDSRHSYATRDSELEVVYASGNRSFFPVYRDMYQKTTAGSWVDLVYSPRDPSVAKLVEDMSLTEESGFVEAGALAITGGMILAIYSYSRYRSQLQGFD